MFGVDAACPPDECGSARITTAATCALVGLGTAVLVVAWVVADATGLRLDRFGAVALGLATAAGVAFVVLAGLWHVAFVGPRALPV